MTNLAMIMLATLPTWPGDVDGNGRVDVLDYAALQRAELVTGKVVRGDQVTLAVDRPMTVQSRFGDLVLREAPVAGGQWQILRNRGCDLHLSGEDITVLASEGDTFTVGYWIFVDDEDGDGIPGTLMDWRTVQIYNLDPADEWRARRPIASATMKVKLVVDYRAVYGEQATLEYEGGITTELDRPGSVIVRDGSGHVLKREPAQSWFVIVTYPQGLDVWLEFGFPTVNVRIRPEDTRNRPLFEFALGADCQAETR